LLISGLLYDTSYRVFDFASVASSRLRRDSSFLSLFGNFRVKNKNCANIISVNQSLEYIIRKRSRIAGFALVPPPSTTRPLAIASITGIVK
jgi:hypothetical protein